MASKIYNNLPPQEAQQSSSDLTLKVFDQYYEDTIELNNNDLIAMKGYFTKRGFDDVAAENTAITVLKQAKVDGINPFEVMDTLDGLSDVELNVLLSEILNFNRFKTSAIGTIQLSNPPYEIVRNILP